MRFPGQRENEEIEFLVRKHWISDFKVILILFFLGMLPLAVYIFFAVKYFPDQLQNDDLMIMFFVAVYLLCVLLASYIAWLNHELDIMIVTNQRVLNHDQVDFLHRQISETNLDQIQDIKGSERGLIQTIFHFGVIEIRTASDVPVFRLHDAEKPFENAQKILNVRNHYINHFKHQ